MDKRINLSISPEQHAALVAISKERKVPVQALIRQGVTGITGVADPIGRYRRRNDL